MRAEFSALLHPDPPSAILRPAVVTKGKGTLLQKKKSP
jgi:hypothetical protein